MDKTNQTEEPKKKPKNSKKLVIIIGVLSLFFLFAFGVGIYSLATDTSIIEMVEVVRPAPSKETLVLEEFLVNLNSEAGHSNQYLKINIALGYLGSRNTEVLISAMPMIRNEVLACLRELRRETVLEEESIEAFREQAKKAINARLEGQIEEIYITNMIVR
jgi:flagellar basal body-associated protein FliL